MISTGAHRQSCRISNARGCEMDARSWNVRRASLSCKLLFIRAMNDSLWCTLSVQFRYNNPHTMTCVNSSSSTSLTLSARFNIIFQFRDCFFEVVYSFDVFRIRSYIYRQRACFLSYVSPSPFALSQYHCSVTHFITISLYRYALYHNITVPLRTLSQYHCSITHFITISL